MLFRSGIPAASEYTFHLVIWITFFGGMITSRESRHLSLSAGADRIREPLRGRIDRVIGGTTAMVIWALFLSALSLLLIGFDPEKRIGFLPVRFVLLPMPIGYAVMAFRAAFRDKTGGRHWITLAVSLVLGVFLGYPSLLNILYTLFPEVSPFFERIADLWYTVTPALVLPGCLVLIAGALLGMPLFTVLGGVAYFLFIGSGGALEVIPNEAYTMLTGNTIPPSPCSR